jgi:hypothetical protein
VEAIEMLQDVIPLGKQYLEIKKICFRPEGEKAFTGNVLDKVPLEKFIALVKSAETRERVEAWIPLPFTLDAERAWHAVHEESVPEGVVIYALFGDRDDLKQAAQNGYFFPS